MKITTLKETIERVVTGEEDFPFAIKEFLDGFKIAGSSDKRAELISEKPAEILLEDLYMSRNFYDVLIAGIVSEIAFCSGLERPSWTNADIYYLSEPEYTTQNLEKRELYFVETPSFYSERNLFCGKILDPLNTPSVKDVKAGLTKKYL